MAIWQQNIFAALQQKFMPAPLLAAADLAVWTDRHAAFIAQKCLMNYLRARLGTNSNKLLTEEMFIVEYDRCRWESWAAACSDLLIMALVQMRADLPATAWGNLAGALRQIHADVLAGQPVPAHRPGGWEDVRADHARRMSLMETAMEADPARIGLFTARRMHATLPIHVELRNAQDREFIYGAVRMQAVQAWDVLRRRRSPQLSILLGA